MGASNFHGMTLLFLERCVFIIMVLIVYRKDGEITHVHENKIDLDILTDKIQEYNNTKNDLSAEYIECDEVTEWLYHYRQVNIKDFREELEYIEGQIKSLSDGCNWISDLINQDNKEV